MDRCLRTSRGLARGGAGLAGGRSRTGNGNWTEAALSRAAPKKEVAQDSAAGEARDHLRVGLPPWPAVSLDCRWDQALQKAGWVSGGNREYSRSRWVRHG